MRAGANVKKAMEPARHSDPKLTFETYARVVMCDLTRGQRHNSPTVVGSGKPLRKPELVSRCAAWRGSKRECPRKDSNL